MKKNASELAMQKAFDDLPGWVFFYREVAMNWWDVTARDQNGNVVQRAGSECNIQEIIDHCKAVARTTALERAAEP